MSELYLDDGPVTDGKKVMLATPVYEKPAACYVFSIAKTREAMHQAGIPTAYLLLSGNCHVDDSRNKIVHEFLQSDCTDLVFLDADVSWDPEDLITLCEYDEDVVGGVYPFRRESAGEKMPVLMIDGNSSDSRGLMEVMGLPTGFMKIRRHVLEVLAGNADKYVIPNEDRVDVPIIFERTFANGTRYGGDITFCKKWAEQGGTMFAAVHLVLGHAGNAVLKDSLAGFLRRQNGVTLKYLVEKVRQSDFIPKVLAEAVRYVGNDYGAAEDVLSLCVALGKKANGPIIETGSGLSSIVLAAAAPEQEVFSLESDPSWAYRTREMAEEAGVKNLMVVERSLHEGWYDIDGVFMPEQFALGLNDGPSRWQGDRSRFFEHFGDTEKIIVDDANNSTYRRWLQSWCNDHHRQIDFIDRAAVIQ